MDQVIIFDGVCGLCNKSVDILIKIDQEKIFTYTSLQGEFVKTLDLEPDIDSILFYKDDTVYYKSTAILKIFQALGGIWKITAIFFLIPKIFRDYLYDTIAKYRYKIFGKRKHCRLPNVSEKDLFIN